MYGEYKRNWSTDEACWNPAVHENYPEFKRSQKRKDKRTGDVAYVNKYGDRYIKDAAGRVTVFRYRHSDTTYSMTYGDDGEVSSISSSIGWAWTRVSNKEFTGWLVMNYFECWKVSEEECGKVTVDELGIGCEAGSEAPMGLPERP